MSTIPLSVILCSKCLSFVNFFKLVEHLTTGLSILFFYVVINIVDKVETLLETSDQYFETLNTVELFLVHERLDLRLLRNCLTQERG